MDSVKTFSNWPSSFPFCPVLKQAEKSKEYIEDKFTKGDSLVIFPSCKAEESSFQRQIRDRIEEEYDTGLALVTKSLTSLMNLEQPKIRNIASLSEAVIAVPEKPSVLLCLMENEKKQNVDYTVSLAHKVLYHIRMFTNTNYSLLHGVIYVKDLKDKESFAKAVNDIIYSTKDFVNSHTLLLTKEKFRSISLAIMTSILVTELPRTLASKQQVSSMEEDELWFLTPDQISRLEQCIDYGGECEEKIPGTSILVLEIAQRLEKLGPTLACVKKRSYVNMYRRSKSITSVVALGSAYQSDVCFRLDHIVADSISDQEINRLLRGVTKSRSEKIRRIIFCPTKDEYSGKRLYVRKPAEPIDSLSHQLMVKWKDSSETGSKIWQDIRQLNSQLSDNVTESLTTENQIQHTPRDKSKHNILSLKLLGMKAALDTMLQVNNEIKDEHTRKELAEKVEVTEVCDHEEQLEASPWKASYIDGDMKRFHTSDEDIMYRFRPQLDIPTPPQHVSAKSWAKDSVHLTWKRPVSDDATGYSIYVNGYLKETVPSNVTTVTLKKLDSKFTYKLHVQAVSATGESYPSRYVTLTCSTRAEGSPLPLPSLTKHPEDMTPRRDRSVSFQSDTGSFSSSGFCSEIDIWERKSSLCSVSEDGYHSRETTSLASKETPSPNPISTDELHES